ncbi:General odorant-binding protein 28a [Pseudolycoriella hygida]|uniref:General odorant-binding protein 28a n=1 Tax=Pseudolycoriella hygida TaxID=35572 RepID=A0A9Q0MNT0_9DIPT|nr:General odorant-binding protein 28a [Pseudolycoriella hygida]
MIHINLIPIKRSVSQQEFDEMSELCKVQEKATDSDMKMWKNDITPKSKVVKCLDACVGERMGMMKNNKLDVDAVMQAVQQENRNQKTIADLNEVFNECKSITDPDRCESSAKILECINNGSRKRGLQEIF